ncbi:MAG: response regulator [Leptolinea sp.]|jgi:DNA-binding response OmpR family regulator|nr:response regulator [Leptolinea sp.]
MAEKKKILLLEDNAMMRSLLQTLLELEGFNVKCAVFPLNNPLTQIREFSPDVILMDINLPGISGLSILEEIRACNETKNIKVIMSSGSDRKKESLDAGANSYLMKPYMPDELIQLIKVLQ